MKPTRGRKPSTMRRVAREHFWCLTCRHTVTLTLSNGRACPTCGSQRLDIVVKQLKAVR